VSLHECENPEEIAYVRGLQRRSTIVWGGILAFVVAAATSIVWVSLAFGSLESDVKHLQNTQMADRADIRAVRQDLLEQERRTSEHYQALTEQFARLETKLDGIGGNNGRSNRRASRTSR